MLPHISADLSSDFKEKLEEMLQKYRGETINFDLRKVRKFKVFEFPRPDIIKNRLRLFSSPCPSIMRG